MHGFSQYNSFGYENVETISLDRNVLNGEMPSTKLTNCQHAYLFVCLHAYVCTLVQCTYAYAQKETDKWTHSRTHT